MAYKKLKYWFDRELAEKLAGKIATVYPAFRGPQFVAVVDEGLPGKELKARVDFIADCLNNFLPGSYSRALEILVAVLGPENENETGMFKEGYWIMPIARFVEKFGLDHYDVSMAAIEEITKRHTGEYCIRPFLDAYPEKTLAVMTRWSRDASVHVRRLASEGVRPRLPWARKLQRFADDPRPILPILENLKDDGSRFVQKSVANTVNDILKDNRRTGMEILSRWVEGATENRKWVIRHALRNLLKKGDPAAREIMDRLAAG